MVKSSYGPPPDDTVPGFWNLRAYNFDQQARGKGYQAPKNMVALALPYFVPGFPILDIGAGTGLVGVELVQQAKAASIDVVVDGIDFSHEMLKHARAKGVYSHLNYGDIRNFRFAGKRVYRNAISVGVFDDFIKAEELRKAVRLLDDPCVLAITGESGFFPWDFNIRRVLERQGFQIRLSQGGNSYQETFSDIDYGSTTHMMECSYLIATRGQIAAPQNISVPAAPARSATGQMTAP